MWTFFKNYFVVILGQNAQFETICFLVVKLKLHTLIFLASVKAYTDGGAGQVCSIVGAERERYNLCTNVTCILVT